MKRWVGLGVIADNLISMGNEHGETGHAGEPVRALTGPICHSQIPLTNFPPAAPGGIFVLWCRRALEGVIFAPESS
jgi:hypothetical protein